MPFLTTILGLSLAMKGINSAQVNINDPQSIGQALSAAAANLMKYYTPNDLGNIRESPASDASGFQWYESGIMWGAMMDYAQITQDGKYVETVSTALGNAAFGDAASFLGGDAARKFSQKVSGKWNDDILWWSFGAMSGAEIFGNNAQMPNGVPYLLVATNTFNEVYEQWDTTTCNGGIFWSRDRSSDADNRRLYKSSISNAQFILLGARLYKATGDQTFLKKANDVYQWMLSSGLVTSQGQVFDGAYAPECTQVNRDELSYVSGTFLGAAGWMYAATGNQKYLNDANAVLRNTMSLYSKNGIFTDPCEARGCSANQVQPKGAAVRGLSYLWNTTTDQNMKNTIAQVILSSVQGMSQSCTSAWACGSLWSPGAPVYSDVHTQIVAVELLNAAAIIKNVKIQSNVPTGSTPKDKKSSAVGYASLLLASSLAFLGLFVF